MGRSDLTEWLRRCQGEISSSNHYLQRNTMVGETGFYISKTECIVIAISERRLDPPHSQASGTDVSEATHYTAPSGVKSVYKPWPDSPYGAHVQ